MNPWEEDWSKGTSQQKKPWEEDWSSSDQKMPIMRAAQVGGAQGREIGLSDEARGFRAMTGIPESLNRAYQAVNPLGRFTSIGTGLAGLAGEAMGKMPESYTQARDVERQELAQARADRPFTAYGSEIAQAAVYPAGTVRMGAPLVMEALKLGGIGAVQGGITGYAAGEGGTEDRLKSGATGTVVGGGLGAAMPGLGAAATPIYRAGATAVSDAVDAVVRLFGGTSNLADANARRVAEAAVRRSMERSNMTPEQIAANLERFADKPAVLAEIIGQDALNALTALTRRPGATPEMAQDIIAGRFGGLGERIASDVRQAAPNVTEPQIAGQFGPELAERRGRAAPAYQRLFAQYGNVGSDRLNALAQTRTMAGPIGRAREAAADVAIAEGRDPASVTPLEIMDLAKREIDDKIGTAIANENFEEVRRLEAVQSAVLRELDDLTEGQYAAVRELGGEAPRLQAARRLGERWRQIRLPQFLQDIAGVNPQDLTALRAGIMSQIDDRLNRGTLNPREFRTRDVQEKIRAVFGPEAGDELIRRVTAEAELRETGARFAPRVQSVTGTVAENAPEEFLNDAIGVVEQVRRGNIAGKMQAIGSFMRRRGYGQRQIDEMGRLLLSDPEEGLRRLGIRLPTAPGGSAGGASGNAFSPSGPTGGPPQAPPPVTPTGSPPSAPPSLATGIQQPGPLSGGVVAPGYGPVEPPGYFGRQSFRGQGPITGPATQARMADWEATVPALAQVSNTGQQASEIAAQALQNRTPQALAEAQQAKAILRSEIEGIVQTRAGMATPEDQRLVDALQALSEQTNDPVLLSTQIRNARVNLDRVMESLGQGRPGNLIPVRTRLPLRRTRSAEEMARTIPEGRQSRTRYAEGGEPPEGTQMGVPANAFMQVGLGSAGGSAAGSTTDLNGDGVIDMQDVAIGSVMGGVGLPLAGRAASRLDNAFGIGNNAGRGAIIDDAALNAAKTEGFNTNQIFYRGMRQPLGEEGFYATVTPGYETQGSGVSLSTSRKAAEEYGENVYPVVVRGKFFSEKLFEKRVNDLFEREGIGSRDAAARVRAELKAEGYAGLKSDGGKLLDKGEIRVWDDDNYGMSNVRSVGGNDGGTRSMGFGASEPPKPVQRAQAEGYQGTDTGESKEWLSAIRKGLRMDTESRMARAREMGFDTDTVLYHGTANDVQSFDPQKAGSSTRARSAKMGTWLTGSPRTAEGYADAASKTPVRDLLEAAEKAERNRQWDVAEKLTRQAEELEAAGGRGQTIMPLYVRGKLKTVDMDGVQYDPDDVNLSKIAETAKREGFDGVRLTNFSDEAGYGQYNPTTHVLVFDPSNIRSVHAAFDPEKSGSSTLLAAAPFAVGGVGAGAAMQDRETVRPPPPVAMQPGPVRPPLPIR